MPPALAKQKGISSVEARFIFEGQALKRKKVLLFCVHGWGGGGEKPGDQHQIPGTGVTGICKQPDMGAGNGAPALENEHS